MADSTLNYAVRYEGDINDERFHNRRCEGVGVVSFEVTSRRDHRWKVETEQYGVIIFCL